MADDDDNLPLPPVPAPEEEIMPDFLLANNNLPAPEEMAALVADMPTPSEHETCSLMEQLLADYPDQPPPPPTPLPESSTMLPPLPPQLDNYQPPPHMMEPEMLLPQLYDGPAAEMLLPQQYDYQQYQMGASSSSSSAPPAGNDEPPWFFCGLPNIAAGHNMDLNQPPPPAAADLNQQPPPADERFDCRYCDVAVAELRHTNGRWDVHFSVHVAAGGAFTHAVLQVFSRIGAGEQPPMYIDLRGWTHEAVHRFAESYNWRMNNSANAGMPDQDILDAFFGAPRHPQADPAPLLPLPPPAGSSTTMTMAMPPRPHAPPAPANNAVVVPPVVLESGAAAAAGQQQQQQGGADYEDESRRFIRAAGEEASREPWTPFPAAFGHFCRSKQDFSWFPRRLREINRGIRDQARKVQTRMSFGKQLAEARRTVEGLLLERAQLCANIQAGIDRERAGFVFPRARPTKKRKNDHEASGSGSGAGGGADDGPSDGGGDGDGSGGGGGDGFGSIS